MTSINKHSNRSFHQGIGDQSQVPLAEGVGSIVGDGAPDENLDGIDSNSSQDRAGGLAVGFDDTPGYVLPGVKCNNINDILNIVGIDWVRVSIPNHYFDNTVDLISDYFGEYVNLEPGFFGYSDRYIWDSGASLSYDRDRERLERVHKNLISLDVPGKCLAELEFEELISFLRCIYNDLCPASFTRLDVFWDDFQRLITPHEIAEVAKRGDYTGYKKFKPDIEYKREDGNIIYSVDCVRFGSRGSYGGGKYLRIYDKNLESKGNHNSIRWEVELKGDKAFAVYTEIVNSKSVSNCCQLLAGVIGSSISFVQRKNSDDRHLKNLELYPWWENIQKTLGTVKFQKPETTSTELIDSCRHLFRQYKNLLATVDEWLRLHGDKDGLMRFIKLMVREGVINNRYEKMLDRAGVPNQELFVQGHLPLDWK